jgi:hypothetical protein
MLGDELWAWQSQRDDGSWSIIALFMATDEEIATGDPTAGSKYEVLVHRHRDAMRIDMRSAALAHQRRFGQPIRLAKFNLTDVEEEV